MGYQIRFSSQAVKDAKKLEASGLDAKAKALIRVLMANPYQNPPPYEKLQGDLKGRYSRRINIQHRLVYTINDDDHIVQIHRMWTHYE